MLPSGLPPMARSSPRTRATLPRPADLDDYNRLTGRRVDLVDWLETIEFDPEPMRLGLLDPDL